MMMMMMPACIQVVSVWLLIGLVSLILKQMDENRWHVYVLFHVDSEYYTPQPQMHVLACDVREKQILFLIINFPSEIWARIFGYLMTKYVTCASGWAYAQC